MAVCAHRPQRRLRASMGPRPRGRGWRLARHIGRADGQASMGPRPRGRGWVPVHMGRRMAAAASMGPRPRGRGWRLASHWCPSCGSCFNGATAARPWMALPRLPPGIGRPCFNGATAARPWMVPLPAPQCRPGLASIGPRPRGRGWWQAWRLLWGGVSASMGPRPRGRGWSSKRNTTPRQRCFNGATAARPWMATCPVASSGLASSFNGATAARPWMAGALVPMLLQLLVLQWGHGREAVDGRTPNQAHMRGSVASMGPRPRGRGW